MWTQLTERLTQSLAALKGQGRLTEANIDSTLKDIRLALLEADVNFRVVKSFLDRVKAKAIGQNLIGQISAGNLFAKIVHDELVATLGSDAVELNLRQRLNVLLMVGLQGSGKTTTAAKLALYVRQQFRKKPGLVPLDTSRPAAIEQLKLLAHQLNVPVFATDPQLPVTETLKASLKWAEHEMIEALIVDTAGRLQIDEALMGELTALKAVAPPSEILLVADAMLGQQSVNVAEGFHKALGLTGLVLSKVDGDARGGAALSIREATGVPIKFLGVGEKPQNLELFHPDRLASRLLDLGDVLTLVEKAQGLVSEEESRKQLSRIRNRQFTVDDFLTQLQTMKKLGGLEGIMNFLPGMQAMKSKLKDMAPPDREMKKLEAIIRSMTQQERANLKLLNGSRRLRIANGSGTQVQDVNRFVKQFEQSQKMMASMLKFRR